MEERFFVHAIDPTDPEQLRTIIGDRLISQKMRTGTPRFAPLLETIQHIVDLGVRCVVHQTNVQDPDFLAEHAAYYSSWSAEVSRYCDRFHFFRHSPKSDQPLDVIDQMAAEADAYLGFLTLRPVSMSPVAATILRPLPHESSGFLLSRDEFEVNLAGQAFVVNGTPFMQQDNAVGACAQASIWMALRTLRRREGNAAFSPAEITSAATRFLVDKRTLPNRGGLRFEQITEAIRAAGYSPHTIPLRQIEDEATAESLELAKQALYPYVESGIPVLIILFPTPSEGHAVVLIGHGWNREPDRLSELATIANENWAAPIRLVDATSWATPLFIHNDNNGPYLPLPEFDAQNAGEAEQDKPSYSLNDAVMAIPFLCPDVFIDGSEARETCIKLFAQALQNVTVENDGEEKPSLPDIVVRTYLQDKASFRKYVLNSNMSDDVKHYYRTKWLPKRIWVTELNSCDHYQDSPDGTAIRLGEILLDPSSEPEDSYFLAIHIEGELLAPDSDLGGVIIDRDAFKGSIRAFPVASGEYHPLVREML